VGASLVAPEDNTLERWDADRVYANGILIVDGIGIASGVSSLSFAVRNLWSVLSRHHALGARKLTFESLRRLHRAERLKVVREIFEEATRTPEGRRALSEAAETKGIALRALTRSGLSLRNAVGLKRIISDETVRRLSGSLRDVLGTVGGIAASATPSSAVGSASGSVNYVVNLVELSST
jgi:hypothetical protein